MKTLVLVEHDNKALKDATLNAVTAASQLGEVHLLVAGSGCSAVAEAAAKIVGVGKVHLAAFPAPWPRRSRPRPLRSQNPFP